MENTKTAGNFRKDIWSIRESRKEIFRQAVLEYMPFIYDSIEAKHTHPKFESTLTPI